MCSSRQWNQEGGNRYTAFTNTCIYHVCTCKCKRAVPLSLHRESTDSLIVLQKNVRAPSKEHSPPTFDPMSTHPGASFLWLIRVHSWSVEKHSVKRYAYLKVRNFAIHFIKGWALHCCQLMGAMLISYTTLMVVFAVQSVAYRQNVSFQGRRLCCMLLFVEYLSEFVGNESLQYMGALLWLNAATLQKCPPPLWRLVSCLWVRLQHVLSTKN